jgi:hypothetical protein
MPGQGVKDANEDVARIVYLAAFPAKLRARNMHDK